MAAKDVYKHEPLTENDSIRLIELHPSSDTTAVLQCTLVHTTLRKCNSETVDHYTALSYVWGNPNDTAVILANGRSLEITRSLESALRHLRDEYRVLHVWADAICINQLDDKERLEQVHLMDLIYKSAHHTVIFLGESDAQSESVLQAVELYSQDMVSVTERGDFIRGLLLLLARPWFRRIWIFQELVFSRDPRIQYGDTRVTWDGFYNFLESVKNLPDIWRILNAPGVSDVSAKAAPITFESHYKPSTQLISEMQSARAKYNNHLKTRDSWEHGKLKRADAYSLYSLLDLLRSRRGLGVTDPRDMFYAHFGILRMRVDLAIDYQLTTSETYEIFARGRISRKGYGILS